MFRERKQLIQMRKCCFILCVPRNAKVIYYEFQLRMPVGKLIYKMQLAGPGFRHYGHANGFRLCPYAVIDGITLSSKAEAQSANTCLSLQRCYLSARVLCVEVKPSHKCESLGM